MEIEILSRETIKPTYSDKMPPATDDMKSFPISFLDKFAPEVYIPITLFYHNTTNLNETTDHAHLIDRLKLSFSKTLAHFNILAGRIKGNLIHCSDDGALFVDAKVVKMTMAEFLKEPKLDLLPQFLCFPNFILCEPLDEAVQIGVQINSFKCGGIAIGMCFLHVIIDGATMSAFIKTWAESFKGTITTLLDQSSIHGDYRSISSLFPMREISFPHGFFSTYTAQFTAPRGKTTVSQRFVFSASTISNLKNKAKSSSVPNPTSVEVVSCVLWKHIMQAAVTKANNDNKQKRDNDDDDDDDDGDNADSKLRFNLMHVVNIGKKLLQPVLSEYDVGNLLLMSCACYDYETISSNTDEVKMSYLENRLRESLSEINNEYIQKLVGEDGFEALVNSGHKLNEQYEKGFESYRFTSWCNMGLIEVDFGWGKPVWIGNGGKAFDSKLKNTVILMEKATVDGGRGGIEAWVILDDENIKLLEGDHEFLQFAELNPSIPLS